MALDSFEKQSFEEFVISASFENDLDDGEEIDLVASSVSAVNSAGEDASSDVLNVSTLSLDGTDKLKVQVKGGDEENTPYKITFKAITNATVPNKWELDILMKIKEK